MRWPWLAGTLGLILVAALVFAVWARRVDAPDAWHVDSPTAPAAPTTPLPVRASAPDAPRTPPPATAPPTPTAVAPVAASPSAVVAGAGGAGSGSSSASASAGAAESADAGTPYKLNKDGIKAAIGEKIPELKECYSSWLEANPSLAGKMKVSFTIDTVPETGLGGVTQIEIADGGIDHFAMQGCVMNVFKDLRFEAPENGPLKVNYPLAFATGDAG
jgi:hypothetical protein